MMKTNVEELRKMVEGLRRVKGEGYAPTPDEAITAAHEGRLWDVDTQSTGEDSIVIADSAEEALIEVAMGLDPEMSVPDDWTANRLSFVDEYYCDHSSLECAQCAADRQWRERDAQERSLAARDGHDTQEQARRADDYCRAAGICGF